MDIALRIHVTGTVQGVGFRPFVYRTAKDYGLVGWVQNAVDGVHIHAQGEEGLVDAFIMDLVNSAPPAAHVAEANMDEVAFEDLDDFEIRFSDEAEADVPTVVAPDLAMCAECAAELFDPENRRYRYPFINCTNCGPRFTIIEDLPYDRGNTAMAPFAMCDACAAEYADPADRRFHAQPDACFECGPRISWWEPAAGEGESGESGESAELWGGTREESDAILARAVALLKTGGILAVKGLGGFHLVCDAENASAVARLRERKHRDNRGFAVMVESAEAARTWCHVSMEEQAALEGPAHPIVLLRKRVAAASAAAGAPEALRGAESPAAGVADNLPELGVMLPYTPLQALLIHDFCAVGGRMLVMTSGNVHDDPIQVDDAQARVALGEIADAFLGNNRKITSRYDDSVVRVIDAAGQPAIQVVRRARGYAPAPVKLPAPAAAMAGAEGADAAAVSVLAVGPEQKATFCATRGGDAFVSQHIGDVENAATLDAWQEARGRYAQLLRAWPDAFACDMHPDYLTSKWARERAAAAGAPLVEVQHHHAHVVAAMAEHGIADAVCGFAFDGTGYGADGAIWGGEVLLANLQDYERFANFCYMPMPGGAAAIANPLRMAYGVLDAYELLDAPGAAEALAPLAGAQTVLAQMIENNVNTPYTSSVGRLFDAASALLGLCLAPTYQGEAAIRLEAELWAAAAVSGDGDCDGENAPAYNPDPRYSVGFSKNAATAASTAHDTSVILMDAGATFAALLEDRAAGVPAAEISHRFHDAMVEAIVTVAQLVQGLYGINRVVLSGGVFLNRYLLQTAMRELVNAGLSPVINKDLPPSDGAISYGHAVVASQLLAGE